MLSILKWLLALSVLGALAVAGYAAWYIDSPIRIGTLPVEFEIPPRTGFRAATQRIADAGIPVGRVQFELLARTLGRTQDIKAGSYELTAAPTPLELLDKLTRGDVTQGEVTFIEGWTFRQMRAALGASAFLAHDTQAMDDADVMKALGEPGIHPEGRFFPDTYLFSRGASDLQVLRRSRATMQRHLAREWEARDMNLPYASPHEALVMASIIEKETGDASERDRIAGVLLNRIRIGMLLQADPTVIYGLGTKFDGNLRKRDLLEDGPYNTYTRAGFPPTPIAMPGLASLKAALRPATTSAYYYVARGDGKSEFSRTLEEHNRAVTKYQLQPRRK